MLQQGTVNTLDKKQENRVSAKKHKIIKKSQMGILELKISVTEIFKKLQNELNSKVGMTEEIEWEKQWTEPYGSMKQWQQI